MTVSPLSLAVPVSLADFGSQFDSFKKSAFRLELLEYFTIPEEQPFLKRYQAGERNPPSGFNSEWTDIIKKAAQRDASITRVRVVRSPYHDYLKFEAAWGYSSNIAAGENIRAIDHAAMPFESEVPVLKDFWLFDDSVCFLMEYDSVGRFLGVSRVLEQFVPLYVTFKSELIKTSGDVRESQLWREL